MISVLSRLAYGVCYNNKNSFVAARNLKKLVILLKYFGIILYMNACTQVYQESALLLERLLPRATFHKRVTEIREREWAEEREKMMFVSSAFF